MAEMMAAVKPKSKVVVTAAFPQTDWATIADGSAHLAVVVVGIGARLVHVSSDIFRRECSGRSGHRDQARPAALGGESGAAYS